MAEPIAPAHVLVVEDDEEVSDALCEVLREEGYEVVTAPHGRAALDVLLAEGATPPRLILLDLTMPVMDGRAFLDERRRHPHVACVPVIVITASMTPGLDEHPDVEILHKPVDLDALLDKIHRALGA